MRESFNEDEELLEELREQEQSEKERLQEIERKKELIEEQLEVERKHLAQLQHEESGLSHPSAKAAVFQSDEQVKQAAGGVKQVAKTLMESVQPLVSTHSSGSEEEEEGLGYSEGCDDLSIGLDLPTQSSGGGDDTPVPTTGELEDISLTPALHEAILTPPTTPLRSLLKKQPSFDDDELDGAKRVVHFSDVPA